MPITIHNIRLGFATNSSSSHSVIFLPGAEDHLVTARQFGWEYFTAASVEAKRDYLALLLMYTVAKQTTRNIGKAVAAAWLGAQIDDDWHIDHQSVFDFPVEWSGKGIDRAFFEEYKAALLRPGVVILGGNDNAEDVHPQHNAGPDVALASMRQVRDRHDTHVARKDEKHGYWTLFNRENGAKIRLSLASDVTAPDKATLPELIDLKITDYCEAKCAFCYQDSGETGRHAADDLLYRILRAIGDLHVFEIALGGGEPTLHPRFVNLLEQCHYLHIVPNFTTHSVMWLDDAKTVGAVAACAGSWGFSAHTAERVRTLARALNTPTVTAALRDKSRPTVQHVMGIGDFKGVAAACAAHDFPLLLLGYKCAGRGATFTPTPDRDWTDTVQRVRDDIPRLSVDTVFAREHEEELKTLGVSDICYSTVEGNFSMYIDAVACRMGPSSFCDEAQYVPFPPDCSASRKPGPFLDAAAIRKAFATW